MATKNNPGKFDCYAHAEPDEPMFVLLGRDPMAGLLVEMWALARQEMGGTSEEKLKEAIACSEEMQKFAEARGKDVVKAAEAFARAIGKGIVEAQKG